MTDVVVSFFALVGRRYRVADIASDIDWLIDMSGLDVPHAIKNDHELDALISARATQTRLLVHLKQ
ncbi:hypothetical protein [Microvirga massiliensis]|uniref:hypothetical protein n=1 Tax=Microvirga massiliensis TaxID=1033741 RepID=UPI000661154A